MKSVVLMLQFFTRIPINTEIEIKDDSFSKGIVYFPFVGLVIGLINALVYFGFSKVLSGVMPLVMVTLANILVTGALHLDGLADTCDGIFSARSKERMLEIMKDSRVGTNGAIAIFFDLAMRIILMNGICVNGRLKLILVTPIISRTMLTVLIYLSSKNGRGGGLGNLFIEKVNFNRAIIALIIGTLLATMLLGLSGLVIIMINVILIVVYRGLSLIHI